MEANAARRQAPQSLSLDIETASNWAEIPEAAREALLKKHEQAEARLPLELRGRPENHPEVRAALSPWTGKTIVICLWDAGSMKGRSFYVDGNDVPAIEGRWRIEPMADERTMLTEFWA